MVYKKYINKNGKLHGPYYYESYRDGDKIKKRYLGTSLNEGLKKSVTPQLILIFAVVIFLGLGYYFYDTITGKSVDEGSSESSESATSESEDSSSSEGSS